MKNKILVLIVVLVIIIAGGYLILVNYRDSSTPDKEVSSVSVYTLQDFGVSFALPSGWVAKPYPSNSSLVFLSPTDFTFPDVWEGSLTPIDIYVKKDSEIFGEDVQSLIEDESDLKVENIEYKGYKAIRISGVPVATPYLSGRYCDRLYIQRGGDVISLSYISTSSLPQYEQEFEAIIQSLSI